MAAGASSGRLVRAAIAAKTFHPADCHHYMPSPSPSGQAATMARRPCPPRIPLLKFPFMWESTYGTSRAAGQKAALIAKMGAPATATTEEKQQQQRGGRRLRLLPERQASSVDDLQLLLPLAYEVTRRLVLREFGATWLALARRRRRCWSKVAEAVVHHSIVSCQSFTLIGVAGSLVGSLPCFLEGCGLVLESFVFQFRAMSQVVDPAEIIKLLIEALDMFLIGTALLTFGMGMYAMVYGSTGSRRSAAERSVYEKVRAGAGIRSVEHAKSRFGHAILLLLQAGALEKFKSVPLVTGLDMACFAGAVLASSAGVFLLSKLAVVHRPAAAAMQQASICMKRRCQTTHVREDYQTF